MKTIVLMRLLAALVVLPLGGCLAYVEQPLTDPATAAVDQALLGDWQSVAENGEKIAVSITAKGEHLIRIEFTGTDSAGRTNRAAYLAHTSDIAGTRYLNVLDARRTMLPRGFMLLKYSTANKDELAISLLSEDAVKRAIREGELAGMVEVASEFGDATITAAPEELVPFLAKHDAEMFPRTSVLRRVQQ